jgi:hypothetical protein
VRAGIPILPVVRPAPRPAPLKPSISRVKKSGSAVGLCHPHTQCLARRRLPTRAGAYGGFAYKYHWLSTDFAVGDAMGVPVSRECLMSAAYTSNASIFVKAMALAKLRVKNQTVGRVEGCDTRNVRFAPKADIGIGRATPSRVPTNLRAPPLHHGPRARCCRNAPPLAPIPVLLDGKHRRRARAIL